MDSARACQLLRSPLPGMPCALCLRTAALLNPALNLLATLAGRVRKGGAHGR